MLLKYLGNVMPPYEYENRVVSIVWSPNNLKLAVASSDRSIYLFDENCMKRDRFPTKPVDSKFGKKSYVIKGIAFSPDSTKIAVGQSDCIIYVYKIGEQWGDKKVICNKFHQSSSVTCLIWLSDGPIIVGLMDGKVRAALPKSQKAQTLYTADSTTIALASNIRGTGFLSSHADGSIIKYNLTEDGNHEPSGRICTHSVPAYALAWPQSHILAAGCDRRVTFYDSRGKVTKIFDYSRENDKEMSVAYCSPSGQSVAIGSWNKIRILDWSPRRSIWEEANSKFLPNFYTVTAIAWRRDGSRLVAGSLCGAVEQFETVLKRTVIRGSHEVAYVGPNQVVIRPLQEGNRPVIIRSQTGNEIEDVKVLGRTDNNVVARTANTLLLADIELNLISEIFWEDKSNSEKFFFEFPRVCLIFCSGELTIVEYGNNEPLGSVRTEAVNPHVVSIRINERQSPGAADNKRLAYLLDPRTVRIVDFITGATVTMITHDVRVDWLELSETGHRLLSRDKRARLWLNDDLGSRSLLLTGVSFVSWVLGSDVVVAQTGQTLAVWYNVDAPEVATLIPIRGDAVDVVREDGRTSVTVEELGGKIAYLLDEPLIEFGTALHDSDFGRALLFLEELADRPQAEAMWENVARNAMATRQLLVAARCYAALGDVACSRFLKDIVKTGEKYSAETGNDPLSSSDCWAKLAILNGELKTAEAIYLEQNELNLALDMYQKYWHWEDALILAQNRGWPGLQELRDRHLTWLLESGQAARAAAILEPTNPQRAVKLYLEARRPGRAARLVLADEELLEDKSIVNEIVKVLKATDLLELAGELLEKTSGHLEAIRCYAQAGVFARALELARKVDPTMVVDLERDWGTHLASAGHYDAAINHFIEAGETALALDAAINAHQWRKGLQIVQVIETDDPTIRKQCEKLAEYFASIGERNLAEKLYIRSGDTKRAVDVHIQSGNWSRAHEVAQEYMDSELANEVLAKHAAVLYEAGDLKHAEELYLAIGENDSAIAMYKKAGRRSDMVRLVGKYRPDLLQPTHVHLARELDAAGKPREAEEHYLAAGDWRGAVTAYRSANMWEDALRVAKQNAGDNAAQQVALMWARTLAPELGARLLMRLGYLDGCLQLACEANIFDWGLEIAKYSTPEQKKEVHYRHAMALEDEGRFAEAEKEFINAGRTMEAVQMYIHTRDWESAEDIAQSLNQDAVAQVLVARASEAAEAQDYSLAETVLLRAHKPEIIIDHYKKAGMWSEALRVCREYLPSQEANLRRELGQKSASFAGANVFEEAKKWLEVGEVKAALDILILDPQASRASLIRAAEILLHQADSETAAAVGGDLGSRLFAVGEHALAAQVFLQADRLKDAIDALASVGEWERARRIVRELAPDIEPYLEEKYKDAMLRDGQIDRLVEIDADAGLEILANRGQWNQVFEAASSQDTQTLHKYVAQRAAQLLKSNVPLEALQLYAKYGTPPISQNFNLYLQISESVLHSTAYYEYKHLAVLRTVLLDLWKNLKSPNATRSKFERLLESTHYSAVKCGCKEYPVLSGLVLKSSITLLRYTDLVLVDRAYYEAGIEARTAGLNSEAFVFLNHFLDLEECIEEGDSTVLDVDDLAVTDFPVEVPLPNCLGVTSEQREEVREWILAVSMDQKVEQVLPTDHRGVYVGSLTSPAVESPPIQNCILTGYPVRGSITRFSEGERVADRDDWTKLINTARQAPQDSALNDILAFVQEWCGAVPTYSF
ncbi:intraflagellar transport protein Oseg2 [Megalopta genalis]|uniref:intraflagellar transport protein Oseg2 n=1 Tax=Megalopta genalis TaxID=115081 RepID=UPI0014435D08|nr:intraflagellar transport protein 172 homolog isoform X1 [Megalopta genalis]XP_033332651.1 intraflagellar transport protein 172 homolog isoform X1 [Megalopta genalis]